MGAADDMTPDDRNHNTSEHRALERQEFASHPGPVRLFVDFTIRRVSLEGTELVTLGPVDAPWLAGLDLREGMRAILEEPGAFQMTATLHHSRAEATGQDFWEGELDPRSLIYHIGVAPQTLFDAGPEGCAHYPGWMLGRLAEPDSEGGTGDVGGGDAPKPSGPPTSSEWMLRTPTPWRLLTLGVEGTWEQWHRSLALYTVSGEATFADGDPTVLVDDAREVDARVHVWRLPPDVDYPDGRRVWVAEPDWATVRRIWPETDQDA